MNIFTRLTTPKENLPPITEQEERELERYLNEFEAVYCSVCGGECQE